ncbi:MAG: cytochrome d ubiquinol oxidase subunit II [Gemmatimonadaceae bacterium]
MDFLASIGLPEIIAGSLVLGLNAYVLTGGADFGGGVWDLFATGPRKAAQRALIAKSIGPIWEANHVWLILVVVILFTAFPAAFATLGIVLHIPLSLMLVGVVLRGSSFVFRSYGARDKTSQRRWGRVFAIASVVTPVLLGTIVGAIASGAVGDAASLLPVAGTASTAPFARVFVAPWLAPFPLAMGALALAMFAFLAAVYLAHAATDAALRDDFRRRALGAAAAMFVTAFGALGVAHMHAPDMRRELTAGFAIYVQVATGVAALAAIWALWTRRWAVARIAAAAQVSLILWGWVVVQYPYVIPPSQALRATAAPRIALVLLVWGLVGGSLILIPSLVYLFRTFAASDRDA